MTTTAMRELTCAIIKQAAIDYKQKGKHRTDAEKFLSSFSGLSRYILKKLKEEEQEK